MNALSGSDITGLANDFVTVTVGSQLFGIDVNDVQDVFAVQALTRVPLAPPEIGGVLNLRGRIVTAIDIRQRLGLGPRSDALGLMAVGIERGGESYGLIIDQVGEVLTLKADSFDRNPENLDPKWRAVSKGIYRLEDSLLVVIDVDLLMSFGRVARAA